MEPPYDVEEESEPDLPETMLDVQPMASGNAEATRIFADFLQALDKSHPELAELRRIVAGLQATEYDGRILTLTYSQDSMDGHDVRTLLEPRNSMNLQLAFRRHFPQGMIAIRRQNQLGEEEETPAHGKLRHATPGEMDTLANEPIALKFKEIFQASLIDARIQE